MIYSSMITLYPYVGIIQIRLRVETIQFPLSQFLPAPLLYFFIILFLKQIAMHE